MIFVKNYYASRITFYDKLKLSTRLKYTQIEQTHFITNLRKRGDYSNISPPHRWETNQNILRREAK
jgi:hypothetical protein